MDKAGHIYASFHQSRIATRLLQWSGVKKQKSVWYGGLSGFVLQLPIEIMDGFADQYGASTGDILANFTGSAFVLGQNLLWNEIRIMPGFSFHRTRYAKQRPAMLGQGLHEELIKDYNGQTYWLHFNMQRFIQSGPIPEWLDISLGYSATGMVGGKDNIWKNKDGKLYDKSDISRRRQYFLSLNIRFSAIESKSKLLNSLFYLLDGFKLPFPAVGFEQKHIQFYPLYF